MALDCFMASLQLRLEPLDHGMQALHLGSVEFTLPLDLCFKASDGGAHILYVPVHFSILLRITVEYSLTLSLGRDLPALSYIGIASAVGGKLSIFALPDPNFPFGHHTSSVGPCN